MKLYTELQLKQVIAYYNTEKFVSTNELLEDLKLTPIELPSDEEIEEKVIEQDLARQKGYCHCFIEGAKWMKEQIKQQADGEGL